MANTFTVTIGKKIASKSGYWLISDCPEIINGVSCTFELGA